MEPADQAACDTLTPLENQYQHVPLIAEDAVRVLNLEPASDFQSPLRGSLTQHDLAVESLDPDGCKYSAVSYTWGNPTFSHQLLMRLGTECSPLPITRNADSLLRHLRDRNKEICLWIDGVCLNQKDQREMAHQVPLMGQIYAHAKKVHIWLGDDDIEDAQQAFSLLRRLELSGAHASKSDSEDFLCLERFFNRQWFSRRWVIQEVFFSHDAVLHCGHHTLSLSRVMAVLNAPGYARFESPGWGSQMLRSSVRSDTTNKKGLLPLLLDLHESESSDRRDRIAAIYAMADDHARPPLHYNIGSWKDMYRRIASYYIRERYSGRERAGAPKDAFSKTAHEILRHLCCFGSIESSKDSKVPSWVPNWSAQRQDKAFTGWVFETDMTQWSRRPFSFDVAQGSGPLNQAKDWYEWWLEKREDPSPQRIEVSRRMLRIGYDFLTFVYGCGTLDQVVHPAESEDFWDEVIRLVKRRKETPGRNIDRFKRLVDQADQHCEMEVDPMEVDSLSALIASILDGFHKSTGYSWRSSVEALCSSLYCTHRLEKTPHALNDSSLRILLQSIRSACMDMALLRVQSTVGYYWAIGPLSLVKDDWLTPIIPPRRPKSQHWEPSMQMMSLRPIVRRGTRKAWYPYPGSDPETRLHDFTRLAVSDIDSVHIQTKFAGSGRGCPIFVDEKFMSRTVLWNVFLKADRKAKSKGLPGPIIFDIL